jgi:thiopurine S-methyltransferase
MGRRVVNDADMDEAPWRDRWREGRIGFHEGRPNTFLERQVGRLGANRRVLVPLCGKAEDLAFLAGLGHTVVGIELVEDAVRAFFDEHGITPEVTRHGEHVSYRAGPITIVAGDFFTVTRALVGAIDAVYDRAAVVALPPALRPAYAAHLRELVPAGAPGLVITFEYPQDLIAGPPFAVLEPELRALYGAHAELLEDAPADHARIRAAAPGALERCFAVTL